MAGKEIKIPFAPSTIETIDGAMMDYVKGQNLFTVTNEGYKKVPVVWTAPERAFQSKVGAELRDDQGALIFPMISIERTTTTKDLNKKGTVWGNPLSRDEEGNDIPVARRINQIKTSEFASADAKRVTGQINYPKRNKKIVYKTLSMPFPVYIEVTYKITIRTEYQEQMNDLMTPFITRSGGINYALLRRDNHRYEAFIQQDFAHKNNVADYSEEERKYETTVTIKVLGYLIGDGKNHEKPFYEVRETAVEVKIPRERVMFGEIPEHEFGAYYGLAGGLFSRDPGQDPLYPFFTNVPATGTGLAVSSGASVVTTETIGRDIDTALQLENLTEQVVQDGQTTIVTAKPILENSELIFLNGQLLTPSPDGCVGDQCNDYKVTDSTTITFEDPLEATDVVFVRYIVG